MKQSLYILGTLGAMVASANAQGTTDDSHRAQAGLRIGRVFIGDTRGAVERRLGKPTQTFVLGSNLSSQLWRSRKNDSDTGRPNTLEVVYRNGIVTQIEATSLIFKTPSNLSLASMRTQWERVYGAPSVTTYSFGEGEYLRKRYLDWKSKGIAVELAEQAGDTEGSPTTWLYQTLIVHKKGVPVVPDKGGTLD